MKNRIAFMALSALAALAFPAMAQDQGAAPPKPAMSASMPMDCPMAKGVQGGMGSTHEMSMDKDMKCAKHGKDTADKPAKTKPAHDHGKFHKNQ